MSFYALQFLFWKHKHNQMQNTTLDLIHEWFQLVNIQAIKSFSTLTNVANFAQYETLHTS